MVYEPAVSVNDEFMTANEILTAVLSTSLFELGAERSTFQDFEARHMVSCVLWKSVTNLYF